MTETLTALEYKALQYIREIFEKDGINFDKAVRCLRTCDQYLTLYSPNHVDFCRIKVGIRSVWFSVDACRLDKNKKDDVRFNNMNNRNVRHWKVQLESIEDFKTNSDLILATYKSMNISQDVLEQIVPEKYEVVNVSSFPRRTYSEKAPRRKKGYSLLEIPNDYCVIDLETTGLDPEYNEIIELAAVRVRNNQIVDTYSQLVKPDKEIDEFIQEFTGITNEMVADAENIEVLLPKFLDFIGDDVLIGHNVNFDINFIYDNLIRLKNVPFSSDYIDTMRVSRYVLPEMRHHRLKDLVKEFGIVHEHAHRALSDCQATFEVACNLQKLISENGIDLSQYGRKKKAYHSNWKLKAADITTQNTEFDIAHPLYEKCCVFTGTLEKMTRKEAMQLVVDLGGTCGDNITNKTDFLIVGNFDYNSGVKGNKSSKFKKAEKMILDGKDITILSENSFYDMLESE